MDTTTNHAVPRATSYNDTAIDLEDILHDLDHHTTAAAAAAPRRSIDHSSPTLPAMPAARRRSTAADISAADKEFEFAPRRESLASAVATWRADEPAAPSAGPAAAEPSPAVDRPTGSAKRLRLRMPRLKSAERSSHAPPRQPRTSDVGIDFIEPRTKRSSSTGMVIPPFFGPNGIETPHTMEEEEEAEAEAMMREMRAKAQRQSQQQQQQQHQLHYPQPGHSPLSSSFTARQGSPLERRTSTQYGDSHEQSVDDGGSGVEDGPYFDASGNLVWSHKAAVTPQSIRSTGPDSYSSAPGRSSNSDSTGGNSDGGSGTTVTTATGQRTSMRDSASTDSSHDVIGQPTLIRVASATEAERNYGLAPASKDDDAEKVAASQSTWAAGTHVVSSSASAATPAALDKPIEPMLRQPTHSDLMAEVEKILAEHKPQRAAAKTPRSAPLEAIVDVPVTAATAASAGSHEFSHTLRNPRTSQPILEHSAVAIEDTGGKAAHQPGWFNFWPSKSKCHQPQGVDRRPDAAITTSSRRLLWRQSVTQKASAEKDRVQAALEKETDASAAAGTQFSKSKNKKSDAEACRDPETGEDLSRYRQAWYCILDAQHARDKFGLSSLVGQPRWKRTVFHVCSSPAFNWLFRLAIFIHCTSAFYEQHELLYGILANLFALSVYYSDMVMKMINMGFYGFFHKNWNVYNAGYVTLYTIDFILLCCGAMQPFRAVRPWILLTREYEMRRLYQAIVDIVPTLARLLTGIFIFVIFFAAVGIHIFADDYRQVCQDGDENIYQGGFDHLPIAMVHMFILVTTENYPDVMMPAYRANWVSFFFFGIFILLGVFYVVPMSLAMVNDAFWNATGKSVKADRKKERVKLIEAFNCMDPDGHGFITLEDWKNLMRFAKPKLAEAAHIFMFNKLVKKKGTQMSWKEFIEILSIINLRIKVRGNSRLKVPQWLLPAQERCAQIIGWASWETIIQMLILLYWICFCVHWPIMPEQVVLSLNTVQTVLAVVFCIDLAMRLFVRGWDFAGGVMVLSMPINWLEMFLVGLTVVDNCFMWSGACYFGMCQVLGGSSQFIRLIYKSDRSVTALHIFSETWSLSIKLITLMCFVSYSYAVIGFEAFNSTEDFYPHYCAAYDKTTHCPQSQPEDGNFASFGCSWLIVFQIITTSNWHDLTYDVVSQRSRWAALFFISCFVVTQYIIISLMVGSFIDAFFRLTKAKEQKNAAAAVAGKADGPSGPGGAGGSNGAGGTTGSGAGAATGAGGNKAVGRTSTMSRLLGRTTTAGNKATMNLRNGNGGAAGGGLASRAGRTATMKKRSSMVPQSSMTAMTPVLEAPDLPSKKQPPGRKRHSVAFSLPSAPVAQDAGANSTPALLALAEEEHNDSSGKLGTECVPPTLIEPETEELPAVNGAPSKFALLRRNFSTKLMIGGGKARRKTAAALTIPQASNEDEVANDDSRAAVMEVKKRRLSRVATGKKTAKALLAAAAAAADEEEEEAETGDNSNNTAGDDGLAPGTGAATSDALEARRERLRQMQEEKRQKRKQQRKRQLPSKCVAIVSEKMHAANDLMLVKGDVIEILDMSEDKQRYKGRCAGRVGWFQASHVMLVLDENMVAMLASQPDNPYGFTAAQQESALHAAEDKEEHNAGHGEDGFVVFKQGLSRRDMVSDMITNMNADELFELNRLANANLLAGSRRRRGVKKNQVSPATPGAAAASTKPSALKTPAGGKSGAKGPDGSAAHAVLRVAEQSSQAASAANAASGAVLAPGSGPSAQEPSFTGKQAGGKTSPILTPALPTSGRLSPTSGRTSPTSGRTSPSTGRMSPKKMQGLHSQAAVAARTSAGQLASKDGETGGADDTNDTDAGGKRKVMFAVSVKVEDGSERDRAVEAAKQKMKAEGQPPDWFTKFAAKRNVSIFEGRLEGEKAQVEMSTLPAASISTAAVAEDNATEAGAKPEKKLSEDDILSKIEALGKEMSSTSKVHIVDSSV